MKDPAMFIQLVSGPFMCLMACAVLWGLKKTADGKVVEFRAVNVLRRCSDDAQGRALMTCRPL
jgi:hypothetical protein